jgi:Bifunctional DNA primase/polymerase, N-terminal/Primase C terminal 1 (PriCT-1)
MNTQPTIELQTLTDASPAMSFKEIAMPLVARHIPVIPIPPLQKGAVLKDWPNLATIELEQIEKWNEENPHYNAGAVAKLDGFLMLDCDVPGLQQKIEKSTGQVFPETFSVRSTKGLHFYFKHTAVSRELKKNIQLKDNQGNVLGDVKVNNGYVVGPGSIHPSGKRYELVNDAEIVDAPDWLVAWIKKQQRQSEKINKQLHVGEHKVKEGGRDNFLFDEACKLRNSGQSKEHALINLLGLNQYRCDPPMDDSIVQRRSMDPHCSALWKSTSSDTRCLKTDCHWC